MGGRAMVVMGSMLAVLLGACGDDGGGAAEPAAAGAEAAGEAPASELPSECRMSTPFEVALEGGTALPGIEGETFTVDTALAKPTPIVPDPDRTKTPEDFDEEGATTDLLLYTVYLADFVFSDEDLGALGLTPAEGGTLLALSVVPPTEQPLAAGDVVTSGTPDFESVSTFGNLGVLYQTSVAPDPPLLASETDGDGEAEILHLDDETLCVRWSQSGVVFGTDDVWSLETTVAAPLLPRSDQPFS